MSANGRTLEVEVEEGSPIGADLVVGADGAGSTLRRTLLPDVGPSYSGYVAWRGLCGVADLPSRVAETLAGAFAFFTDPEPAPFPTQIWVRSRAQQRSGRTRNTSRRPMSDRAATLVPCLPSPAMRLPWGP